MDYEKTYNEALERAKQFMSERPTRAEADLMVALFPELHESEEERIRKELVALFIEVRNREGNEGYWHDLKVADILAYLEKQKELPMPNSIELIEMWDKEKAKLMEKKFRGDEWRIAQNAFMDGFARGNCVKFEKQKEQKPAEWSERDEEMLEYVIDDVNDAKQLFATKDAIELCDKEIAWLKSLRSRPKLTDNWKPSKEQMEVKCEPSLPSNIDEAAEDHIRKVVDAAGHPGWDWETQDIAEAFKSGAEWMAGQGVILNLSIDEFSCGVYNACVEQGLTSEDDVVVQIRKKLM